MSRTNSDPFLIQLQTLLDKHKVKEAMEILRLPENRDRLALDSELMWDTIPIICARLRTLNEFRFKTFGACQEMLLELAHLCKPKEVLISLLAELENENMELASDINGNRALSSEIKYQVDDSCFKAILKPLQHILVQLPNKRNETLKWVLSTLNNHILKIPVPQEHQLEGNERLLLAGDLTIRRLHLVLPIYLDFLEAFVGEFDEARCDARINGQPLKPLPQREILLRALVSLVHHPFMYLDLSLPAPREGLPQFEEVRRVNGQGDGLKTKTLNGASNGTALLKSVHSIASPMKRPTAGLPTVGLDALDDSHACSMRALELIANIEPNLYKLYDDVEELREESDSEGELDDEQDSDREGNLTINADAALFALGVIGYLSVGLYRVPKTSFVPCVYSHQYIFERHLPYISVLLRCRESMAHEKGLVLGEQLISHVEVGSLPPGFADLLKKHPIDKPLVHIMRFSSLKSNRQQALKVFKLFVTRFDNCGRYQLLFRTIAAPQQHAVVRGLALGLYKDILVSEPENTNFLGKSLHRIVKKSIELCLTEGTESDLLEHNDTIMGVLNLVRFLCLRDPKVRNSTGIWDIRSFIQSALIEPLRQALNVSRAHFLIELQKVKDETQGSASKKKARKPKKKMDIKILNNDINDKSSLELPDDHEQQVIQIALVKFDMMESVLSRVAELID